MRESSFTGLDIVPGVARLFGGLGTTMIAAERTGRSAVLLEIDPCYVDVIVRRWQTTSGKAAVIDGTFCCFDMRAEAVATTAEPLAI